MIEQSDNVPIMDINLLIIICKESKTYRLRKSIFLVESLASLRRRRTITVIYLHLESEDDVLTNELTLNKILAGLRPVKEKRLLIFYRKKYLLRGWQQLIC